MIYVLTSSKLGGGATIGTSAGMTSGTGVGIGAGISTDPNKTLISSASTLLAEVTDNVDKRANITKVNLSSAFCTLSSPIRRASNMTPYRSAV